ncbi:hypothetical protein F4819DRAFT_484322 [Hypoxylon fuscum]|nr:hypothetical protein F4819DRAFT_484322 [Hypoxylon fuscum]
MPEYMISSPITLNQNQQTSAQAHAIKNGKKPDRENVEAHVLGLQRGALGFENRKEAASKWISAGGPHSVEFRRNMVSGIWTQHAKSLGDSQSDINNWLWSLNNSQLAQSSD